MKYNPPKERFYWLCGLAIPEDEISSVEAALAAKAQAEFGSDELLKATEFHGSLIVSGKGHYKARPVHDRVQLFNDLASVIDSHPNIGRVVVRLDPTGISREDLHHIAFMFLVEKVDQLMKARSSRALLIADHDQQMAAPNVRSLAGFRKHGTDFAFGQQIEHVVDTIHHTRSHESRLLQLVDIYAYAMSLRQQMPTAPHRVAIVAHLNSLSNFWWPTKYKHWPPSAN